MPSFKPPCAGELRRIITIQAVALTSDGMGSATEVWSDVLTTHMRFAVWKGVKQLEGGQITFFQWWEATCRNPRSLTITPKTHRLFDKATSVAYRIVDAADPDMHRQWLYLTCQTYQQD